MAAFEVLAASTVVDEKAAFSKTPLGGKEGAHAGDEVAAGDFDGRFLYAPGKRVSVSIHRPLGCLYLPLC